MKIGRMDAVMQHQRWKDALEDILGRSEGYDGRDIIAEICRLGAEMGHEAGEALLDACPELFDHTPALTGRFRDLVLGRDLAEVERLMRLDLNGPVSFRDVASEKSVQFYDRLEELHQFIDFSACQQAVMVGCGRRPFTVFHIHDRTTVPEIVGLDILPDAIDTARQVSAKLGYRRVHFEKEDGRTYDYRRAQVIYLSSMVSPKSAVVSRIADTAPQNVQIVVWEPFSLGRLWSESVERSLDPRLEIFGRGNRAMNLARDLYLRRRHVAPGKEGV